MCTDEEYSGESSSPSSADVGPDFSLNYNTFDRDLDGGLESVKPNEVTSVGNCGLQKAVTGKQLEELQSTSCKVYSDNNICSSERSYTETVRSCQGNADVIDSVRKKRTFSSSFHHEDIIISDVSGFSSQSLSAGGHSQEPVDIARVLGAHISPVTSSKRQCVSPMKPLPLSPKDTEEFDEMKSLKAIEDCMSGSENMYPYLSSDLQNVDTTPFVKEELKEKIKLRRKKKGLPQLKVQQQSPKLDVLTAEEMEKRRIRRERNRIAAAKCRRKKRDVAKVHDKAKQDMQEQNLALLEELYQLLDEKGKLQAMLRNHLKECTNTNLPNVNILQPPGVSINTSVDLNFAILSEDVDEETDFINESSESSDSESIDLTNDIDDEMMASMIVQEGNPPQIDANLIDQIDIASFEFTTNNL